MVTRLTTLLLAALVALPASAAQPVRTMYTDAVAKEQLAREALADPAAGQDVALKSARMAIAWYEAVVRHHPLSGYCDDALWRAGRLAMEAHETYGQERDKIAATRLLRMLATEYPTSRLARHVPGQLALIDAGATRESGAPKGAPLQPARTNVAAIQTRTNVGTSPTRANGAASPTPADVGAGLEAGPKPGAVAVAARPVTARSKIAIISEIRRVSLPDVVRITIALDGEVPFHDERIPGPDRIFIDFRSTRAMPALVDHTLRFDADRDLVRQVRIGRHPNATTRVVLDATGISGYSIYPLYNPYRLVIDCVREPLPPLPTTPSIVAMAATAPRPIEPPKRALSSRRLNNDWGRRLPSVTPAATAVLRALAISLPPLPTRPGSTDWGRSLPSGGAVATSVIADALKVPEPIDIAAATPPVAGPGAIATLPLPGSSPVPGFSMARQLGLGVSRIVIDPGHGGHDPGAKGKDITEAELVLDVSLRLQKLLQKERGVEVILTRRTDDYIALPERTAIANREGADLFLSIHANASPNEQAHGVETYFLNFANNLSAAAVAARENAVSGQAMGALPDFVKAIALNNKLDESRDFATLVQQSMVDRLRVTNKTVKNLGVKQAPFVVLIGASMPSVLAEISFLTHPQEAKLLKSGAYRQKIAEALFDAVRTYQTSLKTVKAVASQ